MKFSTENRLDIQQAAITFSININSRDTVMKIKLHLNLNKSTLPKSEKVV